MNKKPYLSIAVLSLTLLGSLVACAPASQPATVVSTAVSQPALAATVAPSAVIPSTGSQATVTTAVAQAIVAVTTKLNLNTASEADFLTVPNVGARMLREFLEYRPYTSITQFEKEIGKYVSADVVAAYEKYVYVPISINSSDVATLMQIPGLSQAGAQALIAARPFASTDAFLSALAKTSTAIDLTGAKTLLGG